MSDSLSLFVQLKITGRQVKDVGLDNPIKNINQVWEQSFTPGTGAGQVADLYEKERTLADGVSENLDLAGILTDDFGVTKTFAKIKVLAIRNKSTTQVLSVGGAATLGFVGWVGDPTDVIKIEPGEFKLLICNLVGVTVTPGTGDLLKVANSAGAPCTYDIVAAN